MTEKKRSLRCRIGLHAWERNRDGWICRRCEKPAPTCTNCGRQHDPSTITICTVVSR